MTEMADDPSLAEAFLCLHADPRFSGCHPDTQLDDAGGTNLKTVA